MAKINTYTTKPNGTGWLVTSGTETISRHKTRKGAWYEAKRLARGAEARAVLCDRSDNIITQNTYEKPKFVLHGGAVI